MTSIGVATKSSGVLSTYPSATDPGRGIGAFEPSSLSFVKSMLRGSRESVPIFVNSYGPVRGSKKYRLNESSRGSGRSRNRASDDLFVGRIKSLGREAWSAVVNASETGLCFAGLLCAEDRVRGPIDAMTNYDEFPLGCGPS